MLTAYQTATQSLLQNPPAPNALYSPTALQTFINSARGQLAGEAKCIRYMGSLVATEGVNAYSFDVITLTNATSAGIQGVLDVETLWYQVGQGMKWIRPRPWPWFARYELSNPVPSYGPPAVWTQFGQGAAAQVSPKPVGGGSLYISPLPDQEYTIPVDAVCYPIPLVDDTTPEAIPYLWTDAVPYFAAYLALMSSQTSARIEQAKTMFGLYAEFVSRARRASTPMTLPGLSPQQQNPTRANQLGQAPQRGAAA
jgi:hypothetical protein